MWEVIATQVTERTYDWAYPLTSRRGTELIILHHAAAERASPEQIHAWHQGRGWAGIAYHYYVRKDGAVYRGRPEDSVGGHTLDHNALSVGVCFEGNFQEETMGPEQLASGRELTAALRQRYGDARVICHRDVNATACPGKNFPFEEMMEEMTGQEIFESLSGYLAGLEESPWSGAEGWWRAAAAAGVVDGTSPRGVLTREQLAAVLGRLGLIK